MSNAQSILGGADQEKGGLELSPDRKQAVAYGGDDDTVSIPDFVTALAEGLFAGQTSLKSVKLPSGAKELPARLFEGCTSLEKVHLPQKVNSVGASCFAGCTSLESVPLCPGMSEIANDMFRGCTKITTFAAPDGLEAIRRGAFADCTALESVIISDTVDTVEEGAFDGCTALKRIRVSDDNPAYYIEEDGTLRNKSDGEIVVSPNALQHGGAAGQAAGLLRSEEEIDLTPDDGEEDSEESLEAMDNNFIGVDSPVDAGLMPAPLRKEVATATTGSVPGSGVSTCGASHRQEAEATPVATSEIAASATAVSNTGGEATSASDVGATATDNAVMITKDTGGMGNMASASIEDILSQNIFNRPSHDEEESEEPEIRFASSPEEAEESAAKLEAELTHKAAPLPAAPAPVAPPPEPVAPVQPVAPVAPPQPVVAAAPVTPPSPPVAPAAPSRPAAPVAHDTPLKADAGELNRIAMESDILKQNIGATDTADTPLKADKGEITRIAMESDILSQNVKGAGEVSAGLEELMLLSKESEILRDNTKVSNHITLTPTEKAAKVEGEELPHIAEEHSAIISTPPDAPISAVEKEDPILARIKGAAQKYDRIETSGNQIPGLFVFAEKLAPSSDGDGKFSAHLIRAARSLAARHSLRYIHMFYGLPFDHMEFMQLFRQFILGKNAIYACDTKSTHGLSPLARAFAESANIKLDKESMADQMRRAQEKTARSFRIILQDDYSK